MIEVVIKSDELDQDLIGHVNTLEEVTALVQKQVDKYKLTSHEVVTIDKDKDNEHIKKQRKAEYPSLEEVLHTILDHGTDSPEFAALQTLRQSVKNSYPLE